MNVTLPILLYFCGVFAITLLISYVGVRWLMHYLRQQDIVDRPNERSMHAGAVPRGGGLIIIALVLCCLILLGVTSPDRPLFFAGITLCLLAWAVLSWCDDRFDLSPRLRFSVQVLIASATVFLFGWVDTFLGVSLAWAGPIMSVFGLLWMANLNNFMDGMDGLAAAQAIIGGLTLGVWFFYLGDFALATLCLVIVASSYGFLLWNWHPAKIFMGDVGSIGLGALYATLMIIAANRYQLPILSLLLIFAVFIADATFTILNRLRKGERVWLPHRSHFYQRAGLAGVQHTTVTLVAIVLMSICSLFATLSVLYRDIILPLLGMATVMLTMVGFWVVSLERKAMNSESK